MNEKLVSVITPVYNRQEELKKCLKSLSNQTYGNFEAVVIDDCSTIEIRDIVEQMNDPRFKYVRNEKNGGPYNARTVGWKICRGEYIVNLDSDWEAFPWTLQRIVHYFKETPEADAVTGLFLQSEDSKVFVRVRGGKKLITPHRAADLPPIPDCIGGVRRCVIDEWLQKSWDYFAMEAHAWLTFSLKHAQLYVDEPWALYHINSLNRVTPLLGGRNPRRISDCLLFLDDYDEVLRTVCRRDVDRMLVRITRVFLAGKHWPGLKKCLFYMKVRKMDRCNILFSMVISGLSSKLRRAFFRGQQNFPETVWIE
jgi:glycosyltransferase involved in cell wall biosynthesis